MVLCDILKAFRAFPDEYGVLKSLQQVVSKRCKSEECLKKKYMYVYMWMKSFMAITILYILKAFIGTANTCFKDLQ